jgi:hypothetical protein
MIDINNISGSDRGLPPPFVELRKKEKGRNRD